MSINNVLMNPSCSCKQQLLFIEKYLQQERENNEWKSWKIFVLVYWSLT